MCRDPTYDFPAQTKFIAALIVEPVDALVQAVWMGELHLLKQVEDETADDWDEVYRLILAGRGM